MTKCSVAGCNNPAHVTKRGTTLRACWDHMQTCPIPGCTEPRQIAANGDVLAYCYHHTRERNVRDTAYCRWRQGRISTHPMQLAGDEELGVAVRWPAMVREERHCGDLVLNIVIVTKGAPPFRWWIAAVGQHRVVGCAETEEEAWQQIEDAVLRYSDFGRSERSRTHYHSITKTGCIVPGCNNPRHITKHGRAVARCSEHHHEYVVRCQTYKVGTDIPMCPEPGCDQPRHVSKNGRLKAYCRRHETERIAAHNKAKNQ